MELCAFGWCVTEGAMMWLLFSVALALAIVIAFFAASKVVTDIEKDDER